MEDSEEKLAGLSIKNLQTFWKTSRRKSKSFSQKKTLWLIPRKKNRKISKNQKVRKIEKSTCKTRDYITKRSVAYY